MITAGANTGTVGSLAGSSDAADTTGAGIPDSADVTANEAVGKVAMEEALSKLKPPEPQIIHMKFALDMTFAEIAEVLKIPMGTVTWKYRCSPRPLSCLLYYIRLSRHIFVEKYLQ